MGSDLVGIAGNVVAACLLVWIVSETLLALTMLTMITGHHGRWWGMGLAPLSVVIVPHILGTLYMLLKPAVLAGGIWLGARLSTGFAAWLPWGGWAGAALGLVRGIYLVVRARRLPDIRRVNMSTAYDSLHEFLPERLSASQQTFVQAYRAAHEEQQRLEAEGGDGDLVEPMPDDWPRLSFRVEEVWTRQQTTAAAPYFSPGGDWTVLRCALASPARGSFFLAECGGAPTAAVPFAWGEGRLWVTDIADAEALLAAWRAAFPPGEVEAEEEDEEDAPRFEPGPAVALAAPLQPRTAVLGRSQGRSGNGFSGRGTWTATKWFFDDGATEIFVNYSVDEKRGEFAEKDEAYRAGMLEAVAALAQRERR